MSRNIKVLSRDLSKYLTIELPQKKKKSLFFNELKPFNRVGEKYCKTSRYLVIKNLFIFEAKLATKLIKGCSNIGLCNYYILDTHPTTLKSLLKSQI